MIIQKRKKYKKISLQDAIRKALRVVTGNLGLRVCTTANFAICLYTRVRYSMSYTNVNYNV